MITSPYDYNQNYPDEQSFDWSLKGLLGTATDLGTKYMEFRTATEKREETEAVLNNAALKAKSEYQTVSGMDGYRDSLSSGAKMFEIWKDIPATFQLGIMLLVGYVAYKSVVK